MKYLVTGSQGMLGTDVLDLFGHRHEVFGIDLHNCNILNKGQLEDIVSRFRPDVIIHTAAYTNVDQAESEQDQAAALNERGTAIVAKASRKFQAKLVYISTDYVFDGSKKTPYKETDSPNPQGVYGKTKLSGEQQVQQILDKDQWLIVRIAWLYGLHGKNFVAAILQRAQEIGRLQVVNDQFGGPTYTRDVAVAISALLEATASGIFHVCNSGQCSWYEFAIRILCHAGLSHVPIEPISSVDLQRPAPRPNYSVLDTSKFTSLIGQAPRHWEDALQMYFEEVTSYKLSRHV
ncbi:dTDP-4-dehydrorhamnose reductase [candidate division KSB3 bacterium]|uniref:dTDP-4-dehydrorhamnose reductase n=1 Tax=candidate division KSB3 bacterium TaxID=2044937 RepID=A0A2G6EAE7_9BACT|nr:MAG: dTDP-4-dehydrorhamnose reductase [candidate division KSB3 bacterium]PIE30805.1 MAG: dTDP-4-dehydrorhamnose reductase [candidate division KSB3 bacterium]